MTVRKRPSKLITKPRALDSPFITGTDWAAWTNG